MTTSTATHTSHALRFESLNWLDSDPLPRDQTQSHRLHEPKHRINTIDPITGKDILDVTGHPYLECGELTIYFETEATREGYIDQPLDHPNRILPFPASDADDRGG